MGGAWDRRRAAATFHRAARPAGDIAPLSPAWTELAEPILELDLAPADVGLLLTEPGLRGGRSTRLGLVWHDTADAALAADGISLVQHRLGAVTVWRRERLLPDETEIAPPGAAALLIEETATVPDTPEALLPIAAFIGRQQLLTVPSASIRIRMVQGELRAVTAVRPVCRIVMSGDGAAALAQSWAGRIRLQVPPTSLAAEAFALAGRPTPTRPLGAPSLRHAQTVDDGLAFVLAHLAGVILHHAASVGIGPEPVHQMRVALRRLRSAIALFRRATACPELDAATILLKQLGQALGPARDWDVFTAGTGQDVAACFEDDAAIKALLAQAERRRLQSYAMLHRFLETAQWRELGIRLAGIALTRPWRHHIAQDAEMPHTDLHRFAAHALSRRCRATLAAGPDLSDLSVEALHEIRLHSKRLRYAAEFFAPLFPGRDTSRFLRRMAALQEHLGHLNDGAVAAGLMAELAGRTTAHATATGIVRGFVAARASFSRRRIERSWKRFRRQPPFWK